MGQTPWKCVSCRFSCLYKSPFWNAVFFIKIYNVVVMKDDRLLLVTFANSVPEWAFQCFSSSLYKSWTSCRSCWTAFLLQSFWFAGVMQSWRCQFLYCFLWTIKLAKIQIYDLIYWIFTNLVVFNGCTIQLHSEWNKVTFGSIISFRVNLYSILYGIKIY